ncbi:hypothetical protein OY671_009017, partial [Metschnikowia pulcherrima]
GSRSRISPDIISGTSAGGINGVSSAQASISGQSLEPSTTSWSEKADVDVPLDPDAKPWSRVAKFWAQPSVWFVSARPGNAGMRMVAPRIRGEVRRKVSSSIRARWFAPPVSGIGFSRSSAEASEAMEESTAEQAGTAPSLPADHPLDLSVTATDFNGHLEESRLNSPPSVEESEHRSAIAFSRVAGIGPGSDLATRPELVFAARPTASFPGGFPPSMVAENVGLVQDPPRAGP